MASKTIPKYKSFSSVEVSSDGKVLYYRLYQYPGCDIVLWFCTAHGNMVKEVTKGYMRSLCVLFLTTSCESTIIL